MGRHLVLGWIAVSLLTSVPSTASAARPPARAQAFWADVVTHVDELGRYVVLVDTDRSGTVDHAVLYEAASPLPPTEPRLEEDVRLVYAGDGGPRRVEVSRLSGGVAQPIVQIDLDRPADRGAPRSDRTLHGGVALAVVSGYALWPDAEHVTPDDLALRGLPRFDQAETRHVRTSRRATDATVSDLIEACKCKDCSAGGVGSRTCTVKCSGRMIVVDFGEDCAVECGEGYYACCTCKGLFGSFGSCECVSN